MLAIVPNNYRAVRLQANIWLLQGKLEIAIKAFQAIVTSYNNGSDLTNLSLAYALNRQYEESLTIAQKALEQSPKHPFKLLNLADIEMITGSSYESKSCKSR
jgi:serine/threonine-protein kinase